MSLFFHNSLATQLQNAVAFQLNGCGLYPRAWELSMRGDCMFSLCLCGFSQGSPASSQQHAQEANWVPL